MTIWSGIAIGEGLVFDLSQVSGQILTGLLSLLHLVLTDTHLLKRGLCATGWYTFSKIRLISLRLRLTTEVSS